VLHSEHVISRSGIAVSPREQNRGIQLSSFRSAGVAFLSTADVAKALRLKRHAKNLSRPDTVLLGLSVLQRLSLYKFLEVAWPVPERRWLGHEGWVYSVV
jgi:hypothetical protein